MRRGPAGQAAKHFDKASRRCVLAASARPAQKALLQRAHDLGLVWAVVVVAEEVAQTVDRQAGELAREPALAAAPERGFDGDDNVAKEYAVASGVGFTA